MLDIPTYFNQESIDLIKKLNAKAAYKTDRIPISHVYGSTSGFCSARETQRLSKVFDEDLLKHLDQLEKLNVDFFYALNTSCLGSLNTRDMLRLRKEITNLKSWGIKNFIIAHPFMIKLVKSEIPDARIKISVIMEIDDIKRFKFWLKEAEIINISTSANRNFILLDALKKYKNKLEFLCNEVCLWMCPYRASHYTIESHRHKIGEQYLNDYPTDLCYNLMTDVELLKSRFILPEWISKYEDYGTRFKISGRTFPQEFISKTTEAYSRRTSPENLLDLFPIVVGSIINEQNGKRENRKFKMTPTQKEEFIHWFMTFGGMCKYSCPCPFCEKYTNCFVR